MNDHPNEEKRERGRPPLTDGEPRTAMLVMRITPRSKSRWTKAAQKKKQKLNEFVEDTLDAEAEARGISTNQ